MSEYESVLERTREAFASVARLERMVMQNPHDAAFQINLRAKQRLAERFQEELFGIAAALGLISDGIMTKERANDAVRP